jgi:hypothetical protein
MRAAFPSIAVAIAAGVMTLGCSRHEASNGTMAQDSQAASATSSPAPAASPSATTTVDTIVRGSIVSMSDDRITVSTSSGKVDVALSSPATIFSREPGDLSKVTDNSFVGVTSIPQPDGTQRAVEIHVFPQELRGLGEGSRPMAPEGGNSRNTMTNGSVANSRMTNGNARMTNGAAQGAAAGRMTVNYNGGSQTITVPARTPVTVIAPTSTKPAVGTNVVIPAKKQSDGTLKATSVMLVGPQQGARK